MNSTNGSNAGSGGFNPGGMGSNGPNNTTNVQSQSQLQAQLIQQLSQQPSQQMSHKFPQGNILYALANVQSQVQNPATQQARMSVGGGDTDVLAMARSGNFSEIASLLADVTRGTTAPAAAAPNSDASASGVQAQGSFGGQQGPSTINNDNTASGASNDVLQTLLQQLKKPSFVQVPDTKSAAAAPPPPSLVTVSGVRDGFQGQNQPSMATSAPLTTMDPSKDDRRKAPGSVIVPCRARGMDHNFKVSKRRRYVSTLSILLLLQYVLYHFAFLKGTC